MTKEERAFRSSPSVSSRGRENSFVSIRSRMKLTPTRVLEPHRGVEVDGYIGVHGAVHSLGLGSVHLDRWCCSGSLFIGLIDPLLQCCRTVGSEVLPTMRKLTVRSRTADRGEISKTNDGRSLLTLSVLSSFRISRSGSTSGTAGGSSSLSVCLRGVSCRGFECCDLGS